MALIFNIQRFSVNDGPGIRTNVFFKGCPLNCLWCHNPESKSMMPDLGFIASKCIGCGHCLTQCPGHCHTMENGEHVIDRTKCLACRACERFCAGALEIMGREMTVDEVLGEVMKDEIFYRTSNGGMTVSGGEPMIQFPFITELLRAAKGRGLTCCMETCGFAAWARFEEIMPYVDLFLYDIKETDPARHREYTGADNALILENLKKLDEAGDSLKNVQGIDVEPYHPLGKTKCENLGRDYPLAALSFPDKAQVQAWIDALAAQTHVPVRQG